MGATPTHQADTQVLDHELWEAEGVLRVPPRMGRVEGAVAEEGQHCNATAGVIVRRAFESEFFVE